MGAFGIETLTHCYFYGNYCGHSNKTVYLLAQDVYLVRRNTIMQLMTNFKNVFS